MLQSRRECGTCSKAGNSNPNMQIVRYKFLGHSASYVTRELSTFFHACFEKTFSRLHGWQAFPPHFRVCDFLLQQSAVLQFDNQLHVSHWKLVHSVAHTSTAQFPVYKILDVNMYMNSISPDVMLKLEIHAVDLRLHMLHYYTAPTHITYGHAFTTTGAAENVVGAMSNIRVIFRGHDDKDIAQISSSVINMTVEGTVLTQSRQKKFHENLLVRDFLQIVSDKIGLDNQLHVSQWNLVHVSAFTYPNGDRIFKIFDHYLCMNNIPDAFLDQLEIHAISVAPRARYYLEAVVSNEFLNYFQEQTPPTIVYHKIQHPYGPPDNMHYYREQTGGHGLFGSRGAEYNRRGEYMGIHFSKYIQDNPFMNH